MAGVSDSAKLLHAQIVNAHAGIPEQALRAAKSRAKRVAEWYAAHRPSKTVSAADRDSYFAHRASEGAPHASIRNEWATAKRLMDGGKAPRSTPHSRKRAAEAPTARQANVAAATPRPVREVASAPPVRHLKLVESPKPLVKTEREALLDAALALYAIALDAERVAQGDRLLWRKMGDVPAQDVVHLLKERKLSTTLCRMLNVLKPACDPYTPVALHPDEPQAHGVPVDPAFLAAHEGQAVSMNAVYAAVWSGVGLNGAVYDYRLKDARAALNSKGLGHMDAWRSRGQHLGGLFMRHALVEDITDRVSRTWRVCELHRFLWACREHCCKGQIDAATPITQGDYAGQTVHDVLARLDMAMGLLEDVTPPEKYVLEELAGKPDALAHFERVRAQYAAFWETEK